MNVIKNEKNGVVTMDHLFRDFVELYSAVNKSEWLTVFEENETKNYENDIFTFCAMINATDEEIKEYLSKYDWGFSQDSFGKATFNQYGDDEAVYISGERKDEFEYLVALRYFDKYPTAYEINPKFIWYGNLRHIGDEYRHPKTEEVMIRAKTHKVEVRTSYLKDFLAANKSRLSIVFDHRRYFKEDGLKSKEEYDIYTGSNYYMCYALSKVESFSNLKTSYDYCSSVIGKAIVSPYAKPRHEDYKYFYEEDKFETFVIGVDSDTGEEITFEYNASHLANNFGANPDSPHFLTKTFFDIKVLDKYKADPQNYEIQDSEIFYLRDWSIPFCINDEAKVVVWLGDLGRIPYKEQQYWKAFNEVPKGTMEEKFFARQILNTWTDASRPESQTIHLLDIANEYIMKQYEELLFLKLSDADSEIYKSFVLPTNYSIPEYQQFLMKICKLTAESINTKLFKRVMEEHYDGSKGSIAQLDDFLKYIGIDSEGLVYSAIKKPYDSRNKLAGHRASMKEYNKIWKRSVDCEVNTINDAKSLLEDLNSALLSIFGQE